MSVAEKTEMRVCIYIGVHEALRGFAHAEGASQNPYGLPTCIHTHTHFGLFPTHIVGAAQDPYTKEFCKSLEVHKAPIRRRLCKAPKYYIHAYRHTYAHFQSFIRTNIGGPS